MQTLRFAPEPIARRYAAAVSGPAPWRSCAGGAAADIDLPALKAGDLVIPSLGLNTLSRGQLTTLIIDGTSTALVPIAMPNCNPAGPGTTGLQTHIDYFSVERDIASSQLKVVVNGSGVPDEYLLTVSIRPRCIVPTSGISRTQRLPVPPLTQLTAPRAIRRRICSPACITMVARYLGAPATLATSVADCLHAPSGIYGVWPLALRAAARWGVLGVVEAIDDMDQIAPFIDRGLPVVASIRFGEGELPGAPLASSGGHLVVVTGLEHDMVHVNDPAGTDAVGVVRSYPRPEFARAWLRERGATYLFCANPER
jgi:hypothetical protein